MTVVTLKDEDDLPFMQIEGPKANDNEYKLTLLNTCFGAASTRYLTQEHMRQIIGAFSPPHLGRSGVEHEPF